MMTANASSVSHPNLDGGLRVLPDFLTVNFSSAFSLGARASVLFSVLLVFYSSLPSISSISLSLEMSVSLSSEISSFKSDLAAITCLPVDVW